MHQPDTEEKSICALEEVGCKLGTRANDCEAKMNEDLEKIKEKTEEIKEDCEKLDEGDFFC